MGRYKYVEVEIDVTEEFDDDELIEELESRGYTVKRDDGVIDYDENRSLAEVVYYQIRDGKIQPTDELRKLIMGLTPRVV